MEQQLFSLTLCKECKKGNSTVSNNQQKDSSEGYIVSCCQTLVAIDYMLFASQSGLVSHLLMTILAGCNSNVANILAWCQPAVHKDLPHQV